MICLFELLEDLGLPEGFYLRVYELKRVFIVFLTVLLEEREVKVFSTVWEGVTLDAFNEVNPRSSQFILSHVFKLDILNI